MLKKLAVYMICYIAGYLISMLIGWWFMFVAGVAFEIIIRDVL